MTKAMLSLIPNISYLIICILSATFTEGIVLSPVERLTLGGRLDNTKVQTRKIFSKTITDLWKEEGNGSANVTPSDVVLVFPGAGGPDKFTDELENVLNEYLNGGDDIGAKKYTAVKTMDWQEMRGSVATAAFDGEAVGETIAEMLWDGVSSSSSLESVHCVGISVGAFAANACATTLYKFRGESTRTRGDDGGFSQSSPYLRLTLLDPFTSRGLLGSGYGQMNFGLNVDYAEQYLNTDDPVPTTNDPLPNLVCFDVTGAAERDTFILPENETMHCWPLVYFARYGYRDSAGRKLTNDGKLSRGSVVKL